MKKCIKNKKNIIEVVLISSMIIMLLGLIIFILLLTIKTGEIGRIELPTVYAAGKIGESYKYLYGIIIIGAIATTAISAAYGFLNNVTKEKKKYKIYNKTICIISIFVSLLGFSNLVNNLYPIFGLLGIIQLIFIFKCK